MLRGSDIGLIGPASTAVDAMEVPNIDSLLGMLVVSRNPIAEHYGENALAEIMTAVEAQVGSEKFQAAIATPPPRQRFRMGARRGLYPES